MTNQPLLFNQNQGLYKKDFNLWLEGTIQALRDGKLLEVDYAHLIEELESMGRSEKNDLKSHFKTLIFYLLKFKYQSQKRTNTWRYTITKYRQEIKNYLETSPSFKQFLTEMSDQCYQDARRLTSDKIGLSPHVFPQECPFSLEEILDLDYLPEEN